MVSFGSCRSGTVVPGGGCPSQSPPGHFVRFLYIARVDYSVVLYLSSEYDWPSLDAYRNVASTLLATRLYDDGIIVNSVEREIAEHGVQMSHPEPIIREQPTSVVARELSD